MNIEKNSLCACKGIRSCLICETTKTRDIVCKNNQPTSDQVKVFVYCTDCVDKAWSRHITDHSLHCQSHSSDSTDQSSHSDNNSDSTDQSSHPDNNSDSIDQSLNYQNSDFITIKGVFVAKDVISCCEESVLISNIDKIEWVDSQSGRRKQDFEPKINFKKKKCQTGQFKGFPKFANNLLNNLKPKYPILETFVPVELCHLEYTPCRGSSIDSHYDDFWLWGHRLVTVNLLSDTVLVLTLPDTTVEIHISLPGRSLLVLYDTARYVWQHSIRREHILSRRIAMTWREFTPEFLPGGLSYHKIGKHILHIAKEEF